jgi:hypothetical protein
MLSRGDTYGDPLADRIKTERELMSSYTSFTSSLNDCSPASSCGLRSAEAMSRT